jgi:hypothetical protein
VWLPAPSPAFIEKQSSLLLEMEVAAAASHARLSATILIRAGQ